MIMIRISKVIKLAPTERRRYYPDEIQEDEEFVQLDYQKVDIGIDASGHKEQSTVYLILNALRSDSLALSPMKKGHI